MSLFNIEISEEEKVNLTKGTIYQISEANKSLQKYNVEENNIIDNTPISIVILTEYLKTVDCLNNSGMPTFYPRTDVKRYDEMLAETEAEKEKQLDLEDILNNITNEVQGRLVSYAEDYKDNPDRIIVRAVEILVSRHPEEINKIITDIICELT